jgi:hypothetical protein
MHKSATKCNETIGKWCKNKHGASKIIDTFETYQASKAILEISSSASSDAMRALATFRAPELNKEERTSQAKKQRQACKDKQVLKMRLTFRSLGNF